MPDFDNTPPVARDLSATYTPSNTAPTAKAIAGVTPDNTEPESIARDQSMSNTAPTAKALPGYMPDATEPEAAEIGSYTPTAVGAVAIAGSALSSITMPASFQPAFVNLTGGGNCLDSLNANAGDIGKVLQGTVNGELKSYQVRAGTDEADLPGIVRPLNFDPDTNPVVFVQL
ncbi:MAG: hypothetical protein KF715_08645 [Candidatus Didemnitutus sp.]|nr:hypothetical protein [Candidatus Didemnitutus sp.]